MKTFLITLAVAVIAITNADGQSKKDLEVQAAALQSQLDSLSGLNAAISAEKDSVAGVLSSMYSTIVDKVLKHNFNPNDLENIIDSLRNGRDSLVETITHSSVVLEDSMQVMASVIDSLTQQLEALKLAADEKASSGTITDNAVNELKKLKELLDSGILTQEEFDERKKKMLD